MDINDYTKPKELMAYSFYWSEARLVIGALALLLGGVPSVFYFLGSLPTFYGIISALLKLAWIISGIASVYLVYQWNAHGHMLFGKKDTIDSVAFWISIVSGINLGLTGLLGTNIGMSISANYVVFVVVALGYLWSAYQLFTRYQTRSNLF